MTSPSAVPLETPEHVLADHQALRETLLDNLSPPDLSALTLLGDAMKALAVLDPEGLEMSNEDTGENNRRAVRDLGKDLNDVASSLDGAFDEVLQSVLVRPFSHAMATVRTHRIGWDDWSAQDWVKAFGQQTPSDGEQALAVIVTHVQPEHLDAWYDLVREHSPAAHTWSGWTRALLSTHYGAMGSMAVHQRLVERLVEDGSVVLPECRGLDRKVLPVPQGEAVRPFKEQALQELAWRSLLNAGHDQKQFRRAVWAYQGLNVDTLDWAGLMAGMRRKTQDTFYQGDDGQGVPPGKVKQILAPLNELLTLGVLDHWMNRPGQWDPVDAPALPAGYRDTTQPNGHGEPWYLPAIREGRFTWTTMVTAFELDGHPHLAQGVKALGEPWALREAVSTIGLPEHLPSLRERARL